MKGKIVVRAYVFGVRRKAYNPSTIALSFVYKDDISDDHVAEHDMLVSTTTDIHHGAGSATRKAGHLSGAADNGVTRADVFESDMVAVASRDAVAP